MASFGEIGVCPKVSRNTLDGFFLAPPNLAAVDHHVMVVSDPPM
jgi:hypothetical protein